MTLVDMFPAIPGACRFRPEAAKQILISLQDGGAQLSLYDMTVSISWIWTPWA